MLILFGINTTAEFSCSDYPKNDLIILVDESENNVTYSEYLKNADLPNEWSIVDQGKMSDEEFSDYLIKNSIVSSADYNENTFRGLYKQVINTGDEKIYLLIESFTTDAALERVYKKYFTAYIEASNIANFHKTSEYGTEGFTGQFKAEEYVIKFKDSDNRLIHILGLNEADVKIIAEKYSNLKNSLVISETRHWKARVCKPQTDECTRKIYFSQTYDDFELKECTTIHGGNTISCPKGRIESYANYMELPYPSCEKDDILELKYEKRTEFPMENRFWLPEDFYFEREYPAERLTLKLTVPQGMDIKQISTEGIEPKITESGAFKMFIWEKQDVKPYETENLMPSKREVLARASYSSLKSWDEVEGWFEKLFEGAINKSNVESTTNGIINTGDSREDKIKKIYEWVRDEIRYEDNEIGFLGGYQPHNCRDTLTLKMGDCKDKTALLVSMLEVIGVTAYPVLVSREALNVSSPSPYEFYHAIVAIPSGGDYIWLDPTCSYCPYGYIPSSEQGVDVLILSDAKGGFTKTSVDALDKNAVSFADYDVDLNGKGSAIINIGFNETGLAAVTLRKRLREANRDDVKEEMSYIVHEVCTDFELDSYEVLDSDNDKIFSMTLNVNCDSFASKSGDRLIYDIPQEELYSSTIDKEERGFPIVIKYNNKYLRNIKIKIPAGYTVNSLPQGYSREESFGSYKFQCHVKDGKIICTEDFSKKEVRLHPTEFEKFKNFYKEVNSLNNMVVLSLDNTTEKIKDEKTNETLVKKITTTITTTVKESVDREKTKQTGGSNKLLIAGGAILVLVIIIVTAMVLIRKKQ